jgi:hypothetical protein
MQCAFRFCSFSLYKHKAEDDRPRAVEEVRDELSVTIVTLAASKLYTIVVVLVILIQEFSEARDGWVF